MMIMTPGGLADEVARLAAAAGCDPQRVTDPATVREQWNSAALILLDVDAASSQRQR